MKYFIRFLSIIFGGIIFFLIIPADVNAACLTVNVNFNISNWPGGKIKVSCQSDKIPGPSHCVGDTQEISPGGSVTLTQCSCPLGGGSGDGCLHVEQSTVPSSCQVPEVNFNYCGKNGSTIDGNVEGTCTPVSTPTPAPPTNACECKYKETCVADNGESGERECSGVKSDGACVFNGDVCSADCSSCVSNKVSSPAPTPQESPSPTSEESPPPGESLPPKESSPPGRSPTPTPSPTLPPVTFNPAQCQCDGIESTLIFPGETTTVTAYAKVTGTDLKAAEVKDMTFYLAQDSTVIAKSDPLTVDIADQSATKIRYKRSWQFTLPDNVDKNAIYRVWSQQRCVKKKQVLGLNAQAAEKTKVANKSFMDQIISFFGNIFGSSTNPPSVNVPKNPVATQNNSVATQSGKEKLQLQPLYPATVVKQTADQSCRFLMFKFDK